MVKYYIGIVGIRHHTIASIDLLVLLLQVTNMVFFVTNMVCFETVCIKLYLAVAGNNSEVIAKQSEGESVNWRRYEAAIEAVPEVCWVSGRYIQAPALFLQEEAEMAGEEVVYEIEDNDVPGLSPSSLKMQLTYFDTTVSASGDTEVEAMHAAAIEMLKVRH